MAHNGIPEILAGEIYLKWEDDPDVSELLAQGFRVAYAERVSNGRVLLSLERTR